VTVPARFDVLVYGATSGGVAAAVAAARAGATVALVDPTDHVGGMVASGLTRSDVERQEHIIGGLAANFFAEVGARYRPEHRWRFEPKVAAEVLRGWLGDHRIKHLPGRPLSGVVKDGGMIREIAVDGGAQLSAAVYVDASYEGDLLAAAGVSYDLGRESRDTYGESLAGRLELLPNPHQFSVPVSAVGDGDRLLPHVQPYDDIGPLGTGDGKLQSYCYRVCLTDNPDLAVEITPPDDYEPATYAIAGRYARALGETATIRHFMGLGQIPGGKRDINSDGPVSTNLLGASWDYPEADAARRREIEAAHRSWAQGLFYFLGHDPAVPAHVRERMRRLGLPGDEFTSNGHWPPQLYVRDARRMRGEHILTQRDLQEGRDAAVPDAIGLGGYNIDIREIQWVAAPVSRFPDVFLEVLTEGYLSVPVAPYAVPYRTLLPQRAECSNLLVSTCVSASHVAFASFRMESQFMIAGHAAGVAAAMAGGLGGKVHDVDVSELQRLLRADGQILEPSA
jgi:hypothetical protein